MPAYLGIHSRKVVLEMRVDTDIYMAPIGLDRRGSKSLAPSGVLPVSWRGLEGYCNSKT